MFQVIMQKSNITVCPATITQFTGLTGARVELSMEQTQKKTVYVLRFWLIAWRISDFDFPSTQVVIE